MTSLRITTADPPVRVRFATPADAKTISQLYFRIYTPREGGSAREHYPFPQIMEEDRVIDLINSGTVAWVVAEAPDGIIAGSAAAVRNIGAPEDRIAEIFGVAVEETCRRRGVGSTLLQRLRTELMSVAEFTLCEARTDEAGGWKAARNAGLQPVGFEPYAHAMPVGFESMVLTASWNCEWGTGPGEAAAGSDATRKLAATVCSPASTTLFSSTIPERRLPDGGKLEHSIFHGAVNVRRDDDSGHSWFADSEGAFDRRFALVELCPFQGVDPRSQRFGYLYYIASTGASDVAAARVFYDRTDARARILGLRGLNTEVESQFVAGIVENLLQLAADRPLVIVLCVRDGNLATQTKLEAMGFFPTAYFPGMISLPTGRASVIQYTRLFRRSWSESVSLVTALEWPEARRIIERVVHFHVDAPPTSQLV